MYVGVVSGVIGAPVLSTLSRIKSIGLPSLETTMNRRDLLAAAIGMGVKNPFVQTAVSAAHVNNRSSESHPSNDPWTLEHERILAASSNLNLLGIPPSWSAVRDGVHPVAPERVVIVRRSSILGGGAHSFVIERIRQRACAQLAALQHKGELPESKLPLILGIMNVLTTFYRCPSEYGKWAASCACREALASTGEGNGFTLLHQFQGWTDRPVEVVNSPLDWWLFLFPDGLDWDACDEQPVHWMLAPVFARLEGAFAMRAYYLAAQMNGLAGNGDSEPATFGVKLSQMDRIMAARTVNAHFARALVLLDEVTSVPRQ